jgi:hypothetical protein
MADVDDGDVPDQWGNRNTGSFLPLHWKWQRFSVQLQLVAVLEIVGGEHRIEANFTQDHIKGDPRNAQGSMVESKHNL